MLDVLLALICWGTGQKSRPSSKGTSASSCFAGSNVHLEFKAQLFFPFILCSQKCKSSKTF